MSPSSHTLATDPSRRTDASNNRRLVIAAARVVFAEHGIEASVDAIARRAGVGKATVYRNFPTKDHLIAAVAVERVRSVEQMAADAAINADAWDAFRGLLADIAEMQARDRIVLSALHLHADVPELIDARAAAAAAIEHILQRAKEQGHIRADATYEDVRVLLAGLLHSVSDRQRDDPRAWRRYGELIANAVRIEGP
jgi:AcrR family transcriptional regulator